MTRQLATLEELAELGMRVARAICAEAEAPATPDKRPSGDLALMFSRVAKAVRMTLALEARLAEGPQVHPATNAAPAARAIEDPRVASARRKLDVRLLVEDAIALTENEDHEAEERLLDQADERLHDPDEEARFRHASVTEWAAAICHALGVPFDTQLWIDPDERFDGAPPPHFPDAGPFSGGPPPRPAGMHPFSPP